MLGCTWVALWATLVAMGPMALAILNPPYFNLAEGRRITATATCGVGVSGPELYCKLVGAHADQKDNPNVNLIQGQVCDFCDPTDPNLSHGAEYAIDGSERWWQSPPLSRGNKFNEINVTIDLGQEFHVAYVFIKMANAPRPGVWVLERSTDLGETWEAWQYFADTPSDCVNFFGQKSLEPLTRDDSVICETKFSSVVPLEGGEIVVSLLNDRPSANNFYNSTILQEWTKATNIRLRLIRTKTLLGHLMSVARQDPTVTRRYFYSIRDVNIGGRCVCNGHADLCDITDPNDIYKLLCRCQHNTCGAQCENCCPGYVQKKWRRATPANLNECEPCNCFGHSNQCEYDAEVDAQGKSLDIHGRYVGGGVCQNCQHNTEGVNCNRCKPGYYRPYGKPLNATDVCYPCQCQQFFSTGSCAEETGQCECRVEFLPPYCDKCNLGYFGYPNCRPCDCNLNGTRGPVCEVGGGQCPCKPNYRGKNCDVCAPDYYLFPDCLTCGCNSIGSVGSSCDLKSGQCECRNNFGGRTCSDCGNGYYNYPSCKYCNCDLTGTLPNICDKSTGSCLCQEGYSGQRCDQCALEFYGYPQCRVCKCNEVGSTNNVCDETGQCRCLINFAGKNCDQCSPGYYRYPECLPCNCDSAGSIGLSCDDDGRCQCRPNFDGVNCKVCKQGYYNYPSCEECNCNPAGVLSTFAGCDSLSSGDLCQCKERVTGRICNHCRPLFWNLQPSNPLGCEDCNCHFPGTLGGIGLCEEVTGQCFCKTNVRSTKCKECRDGTYDLQETNLFGCIDCGCDAGGAVGKSCDKQSGQCICRPRISGRTCNEPLQLHYFPSLFQYLYELEDGHTPGHTAVRFGYSQNDFPGYSWRGYGVFSQIQKEILLNIYVDKPSLYRVVTRYANPGPEAITGTVTFTPDSSTDIQQTGSVRYEPTDEPQIVTVKDKDTSVPFPFVLNPGRWTVTINGERPLLMDYMVLLPSAYYEGTILQERVENPCVLGETTGKCRHYKYPELGQFPSVRGEAGYIADGDARIKTQTYDDQQVLAELGTDKMALLDAAQREMYLELFVPKPGRYVLVILYHSSGHTANIHVEALSSGSREKGRSILYHCPYSALCRQTVTDMKGKVVIFNLDTNYVTLHFKALDEQDLVLAIDSVVAIPNKQSHMDIIRPESSCIRSEGKCLAGGFQVVPDTVKVEAEEGHERASNLPADIFDSNVGLVYLDHKDAMVEVKGSVAHAGNYKFVVHYYQTQHAEFDLDVLVQNGQFYEGVVPVPFCPTTTGCRAVVKTKDGGTDFQIIQNFIVVLKEPNHKSVWIDYVLAIPSDRYDEDVLQPLPLDKSADFITQCGQNHFYLDAETEGFCRDAVFSLTSEYNNGGLQCDCDVDGSLSFECHQFGGQCPCKDNVIGRTCTECRTGHYAFPDCKPCNCPSTAVCHPKTGACICPPRVTGAECNRCLSNTYGFDPIIGCEECDCSPLGVIRGNLQCDLQTGLCDCKNNIVGRKCDRCRAGYWGFPFCQLCNCDLRGTKTEICDPDSAVCFCKENVYGAECSECTPGTFNLEEKNPAGCTKCFCFGRSERCSSSYLFWYQVRELEGWRAAPLLIGQTTVHEYPATDELTVTSGQIVTDIPFDLPLGSYYYFRAPDEYLGNKVTSYGGKITYVIEYANARRDAGASVVEPEVILMGNNLTLVYEHGEQAVEKESLHIEVELREWNFRHVSRAAVTREQLMLVLAYLDKMYLKATYHTSSAESRLSQVTLDIATRDGQRVQSSQAVSVEQCQCPPNYQGTSCEDCSKGYFRSQTGPYGGFCIPCNCNNHAESCDPITGACINCQHNTMGTHCEQCVEGFHGDATFGSPNDCLICACPEPVSSNNFATSCELSLSGLDIRCVCKEGYTGARCDYCSAGFYGRPTVIGDYCKPCRCNENIDTNSIESCDSVTGECLQCLNNTHGAACEICKPGYYGDAIKQKNCKQCYCDQCGMKECHHSSGSCICKPNVEGEACDTCRPGYWGFESCEACIPCDCSHGAASRQCDIETGQCECKPGVDGRTCDRCLPGYWNLGPNGCKECKCKQNYSTGGTCNPYTGRCECLPGVVGDRCDSCPHRWVLVGNVGCQECGLCIHVLLDDLDGLHLSYDVVWKDIENVAVIQFAYTRLANVNRTVDELWPKVNSLISDKTAIDLLPLELQLETVEQQSIQLEAKAERAKDHSNKTTHNADKTRQDALEVEKLIRDTIKEVQGIVDEILRLALGLVKNTGPNLDRIIAEAERMLAEIKARNFTPAKEKSDTELQEALDLLERAKAFALPAKQNKERLVELRGGLDELQEKLRELLNISSQALDTAKTAEQLNTKNKKPGANEKVQKINLLSDNIETLLAEARELLAQARKFLEDARNAFAQLGIDMERLKQLTDELRAYIQEMEDGLQDVSLEVRKAQHHADRLMQQAKDLDNLLVSTREIAKNAVLAVNSYTDIVNAINKALEAATLAVATANNATYVSDGIDEDARSSLELSRRLLEEARRAKAKVEEDLAKRLLEAKAGVDVVAKMNQVTRLGLDELTRAMDRLPALSISQQAEEAKRIAATANEKATDALDRVQYIVAKLPDDKQRADQIPRDIEDANQAIKRASNQVNTVVGLVPDLTSLLTRLERKESDVRVVGTDVGDKIKELKRKIALARDQANRITVGMKFYENTTLQLHNPEGLQDTATSTTLSLFFKTKEPHGLLVYLGNEMGTHERMKRTRTDDYMALEINEGNVNLQMSLGSGHKKIHNDRKVDDGQWHQVLMERIGRTVTLRVRTHDEEDLISEDTLPGNYAVFNLDQELSKFYVGGIPKDAAVQPEVGHKNFVGSIEEVVFDEKPVGLWNFHYGENNYDGEIARDKLVKDKPETEYQFGGNGYLILPRRRHNFANKVDVIMRFKTYAENGLLFLIGDKNEFFSLEIKDGKVLFQFNLGAGTTSVSTKTACNNGSWHSVEVYRSEREYKMKFNGIDVEQGQAKRGDALLYTNDIYIGGYPKEHSFRGVTNVDFEGCIDNVQIGSSVIELSDNKEAFGVIPGCPAKVSRSVTFSEDNRGHIGLPELELEDNPTLTFRFKTQQSNSLLFYTANSDQSNYLSVSLAEGILVVRSHPGGSLQSVADVKYNDAEWHYVSVSKDSRDLRLVVDDYDEMTQVATSSGAIKNTLPMYFGGVPQGYSLALGAAASSDKFIGCISDATINGKFQNFADAKVRVGAMLVSCHVTTPPTSPPPPPPPELTTAAPEAATTTTKTTTVSPVRPRTRSTPRYITTTSPTTTASPIQCKLPLRPGVDGQSADGRRYGNTHQSRDEHHIPYLNNLKSSSNITFSFKTGGGAGVIFYISDNDQIDFMAAYMKDKKVVFAFNLGSGTLEVTSPKTYSDNQWHIVEVTRQGALGRLKIDGVLVSNGTATGSTRTMNVVTPLYIGGLPKADHPSKKEAKSNLQQVGSSFNGCIRDVRMQGQRLGPPKTSVAVAPCSRNVEKGVFFGASGGHAILFDRFQVGIDTSITFSIKPRNLSGVLMAVHGRRGDFMAIQMINGTVKFSVDNGAGIITTVFNPPSHFYLCDGEWHRISVVKAKNLITLSVDDMFPDPGIGVPGVSSTDTNDPLYIGGMPKPNAAKGIETTDQFVGCISDVEIKEIAHNFANADIFGSVTINTCPTI